MIEQEKRMHKLIRDITRIKFQRNHFSYRKTNLSGQVGAHYFLDQIVETEKLTIDMIDVIGTHVFIVGLLPAEGKFVSDTIRKRLGFSKPITIRR